MMSIMCAEAKAHIAMLERCSGEPAQRAASWIRGDEPGTSRVGRRDSIFSRQPPRGCSRRTPPRATLAAHTPRRSHAG